MEYNQEYKRTYIYTLHKFSVNIKEALKQLKENIKVPNDFYKKSDIQGIIKRLEEINIEKTSDNIKELCAEIERSEKESKNLRFSNFDLNMHSLNYAFNQKPIKNRKVQTTKTDKKKINTKRTWEKTNSLLANKNQVLYKSHELNVLKEINRNEISSLEAKTIDEWVNRMVEDHEYILNHPDIYRYGDSKTFPPCEWEIGLDGKPIKYTACNRLVSRQLYEWGFTDMGRRRR